MFGNGALTGTAIWSMVRILKGLQRGRIEFVVVAVGSLMRPLALRLDDIGVNQP